jgi:hypothetical protein
MFDFGQTPPVAERFLTCGLELKCQSPFKEVSGYDDSQTKFFHLRWREMVRARTLKSDDERGT